MAKRELTELAVYLYSALGFCGSIILWLSAYIWKSRGKEFDSRIRELRQSFGDHIMDHKASQEELKHDIERLHRRIDINKDCIAIVKIDAKGIDKKLDGHISQCTREHRND